MPWVNIDDGFEEHPKVIALMESDETAGLLAVGLFTLLLSRCARRLSDGKFSKRDIAQIAPEAGADAVAALRAVGLVDEADGQMSIHDYLDWNPSREKVLEKRAKRAEAGAKGGRAKAANQASAVAIASPDAEQPAKGGGTTLLRPMDVPHSTTTPLQVGSSGGEGARGLSLSEIDDAADCAANALVKHKVFDEAQCEMDRPSLRSAIAEGQPPAATDWDRVAERIKAGRDDGTIFAKRPGSALKFVLNGGGELPIVGGRPKPRVVQPQGPSKAMKDKYGGIA